MTNIFDISNELISILQEIEENGGELTPELEERLNVTETDFKNKIRDYVNVIKAIEGNIETIDKEIQRLTNLKKSKNSIIDNLQNRMIYYINKFGDTSKSGGKYVDYETGKVLVRKSKKVDVDEVKVKDIIDNYFNDINYLDYCNTLTQIDAINKNEFIDSVKRQSDDVFASDEELHIIVNNNDLENIGVSIELASNLSELFEGNGFSLIKFLTSNGVKFKYKPIINKLELKKSLSNPDKEFNICQMINNETIQIK